MTLRLAAVAFMTAALFAAGPELVHREQQRFAATLGQRALGVGEAESLESVRRLQLMGLPAVEPLMKLAASQRTDIASAAQQALADQLAAWEVKFSEHHDQEAFAEEIDVLTSAIGARYSDLGRDGRRWAQRLARQLAAHGGALPGNGGWRAVHLYDRILAAETFTEKPSLPQTPFPETDASVSEMHSPKPLEQTAPPQPVANNPIADLTTETPVRPEEKPPIEARPLPPRTASLPPLEDVKPLTDAPRPLNASTEEKRIEAPRVIDVPSPLDMRHRLQEYRGLTDRQLMVRLETASRYEAAAVRKILAGRGYTDEMLELTRELRKLPAPQRLEAMERAATLPTRDARLLLRWFLADDDAEVRLQALTTLATSGDPKIAEIARRCAVEDADPRVADLASKLLKLRK